MLIDVRPRTRKPQFGTVEIDWGHPLACGLIYAILANDGGGIGTSIIPPAVLTEGSTRANWNSSTLGFVRSFPNSTNVWVETTPLVHASAVAFSVFGLGTTDTVTGDHNLVDSDDSGVSPRWFQLRISGTSAQFITFPVAVASGGTAAIGRISLGGSADATNTIVYLNGQNVNSTASGSPLETGTSNQPIRFGGNRTPNNPWSGTGSVAYAWSRVLTDAEFFWIDKEPYAFLRPRVSILYNFPGGTATTPPATTTTRIPALTLLGVGA